MARASAELIIALRQTAARLHRKEVKYQWASFAHCNCGHLAQTITRLDPDEIQARAMRREGDWRTQARDFVNVPRPAFDFGDRPALDEGAWEPENVEACQVTGAPLDELLQQMYALGLDHADVGHLERLSDPVVRRALGTSKDRFAHHVRENVVAYLEAWADVLESSLDQPTDLQDYLEAAE